MGHYRVYADTTGTVMCTVEADTPEQALEHAKHNDTEWDLVTELDDFAAGDPFLVADADTDVEWEVEPDGKLAPSGDALHEAVAVLVEEGATNPEGLTFAEWLIATGVWVEGDLQPLPIGASYEAWLQGEDPTEWKASDGIKLR